MFSSTFHNRLFLAKNEEVAENKSLNSLIVNCHFPISLYSGTSCVQLKSWGLHYYARRKEWTVWDGTQFLPITLSKCKLAHISLLNCGRSSHPLRLDVQASAVPDRTLHVLSLISLTSFPTSLCLAHSA